MDYAEQESHLHMSRNNYAAIDLGTNNCRLLIAKAHGQTFKVIDSFSRIVRLGEGLSNGFQLDEKAIGRTLEALNICAKKMNAKGITKSRAIATEACRRASNTGQFYKTVFQETGIEFETISSEQEAQLTLDGCAQLLDKKISRAIVFDIGGGSTEIMWVKSINNKDFFVLAMLSLPIGVVTLSEQYADNTIKIDQFEEIIANVDQKLAPFDQEYGISNYLSSNKVQMLGTSGTVTTLGGIYLNLPRYDRSKVDGLDMRVEAISAISESLVKMNHAELAKKVCIGEERAGLVVMGCAILEAICRRWPSATIRAADRGIREGLLTGLMRDNCEISKKSTI
jgi:exopolyphosphatase/guanosine-5'-triphosphate,3'-diphosphate pyrophosphatase